MLRRFANNAALSKSLRLRPIQIAWPLYLAQRRKSNLKLDDKVVIVTGAGLGIGAATCIAYSHEGSNIVLADLNQENLDKIARICEENCAKTLCVKTDVTQEDQLKELVRATIEKFGKIHVLVNNAGILTFGSLIKGDVLSSYDKVLAVNLRACVQLTMLSAQHLLKTKGNVINVSSILGRTYAGNSKYMPYCISKAGLDHFMFGAALEFAPHGVRVNNICPGPTKTEIFEKAGVKGDWKDIAQSFKLGEMSEPSEVADLIVYISSYKARSITGVRIYIDRGHLVMG
uniref:Short-chain dehydrogenase n=1 Tax=Heliothis virescens TaxID=7102 RepID=A0A2A4IW86_HELVI